MNDSMFLLCLIYLVLASAFIGFMPDEFFTGSAPNSLDNDELKGDVDGTLDVVTGSTSFFGKVLVFLFIPIVLSGVPAIITWFLSLINMFCIIVVFIYLYNKIRGI